jgi:hypothetical protein
MYAGVIGDNYESTLGPLVKEARCQLRLHYARIASHRGDDKTFDYWLEKAKKVRLEKNHFMIW